MELPVAAEELAAEVTTDPETLAAACEAVQADADGSPGEPCGPGPAGPGPSPADYERGE
jgi:hypothetical protein